MIVQFILQSIIIVGLTGEYVNPYEVIFMKTNLVKDITFVPVATADKSGLRVYPNPATDMIRVIGSGSMDQKICQIYNSSGVLVKSIMPDNNGEIMINDIPWGLYIVRFPGFRESSMFIKQP